MIQVPSLFAQILSGSPLFRVGRLGGPAPQTPGHFAL